MEDDAENSKLISPKDDKSVITPPKIKEKPICKSGKSKKSKKKKLLPGGVTPAELNKSGKMKGAKLRGKAKAQD